jgi:hypothetical protein
VVGSQAAICLLVGLLVCGCVELQSSFEVTPRPLPTEVQGATWPRTPVTYCVVRGEEGGFVPHETFAGLAQDAMAAWPLPTAFQGECPGPVTGGNGINEIGWGDLPGEPATLTEAGQTSLRYLSDGRGPPDIVEADVTIERLPGIGKATEACLYTTLLHEAGHMLGVPHLATSNVMSPVITDCIQELTPADRAALEALY